ncbi:hypothetical protein CCM_02042 [Cordyceps militaris CM01]|uniref:Uncharacterized protein n=1 Tax=Cordyceps militaris (strain CM01) TaxID=983644 RepID=G3JCA8_CORMM|nr:uncharacterized protein CCM_02042 [Cordyceps militaris CM01]EGX93773.1 hypothetical protein CCM_02042 [Cordyceps militaris CM01]
MTITDDSRCARTTSAGGVDREEAWRWQTRVPTASRIGAAHQGQTFGVLVPHPTLKGRNRKNAQATFLRQAPAARHDYSGRDGGG